MVSLDDDPPTGDNFDLDRIVIDPDYRRLVLSYLRQDRLRTQAALHVPPAPDAAMLTGDG